MAQLTKIQKSISSLKGIRRRVYEVMVSAANRHDEEPVWTEMAERLGITIASVAGAMHGLKELDILARQVDLETINRDQYGVVAQRQRYIVQHMNGEYRTQWVVVNSKGRRVDESMLNSPRTESARRQIAPKRHTLLNVTGLGIKCDGSVPPIRFSRCQWIPDGVEPSADDSCKCLKPVTPGSPYCAYHESRRWDRS